MESFTIFLSLIWLLQSQILATWRKQPQSRDYSHCVLSDLTRKVTGSLVTRLGPKARPSALVGFESGTFQSVVDALFHCATLRFQPLTIFAKNSIFNVLRNNVLII